MLYKQPKSTRIYKMGPFTIQRNLPGAALPDYHDHGYGPLALFDYSTMEPGTLIAMHEHRNDEIISYVPRGTMRHDDGTGTKLDIDHTTLIMNAGASFWHEERTLEDDETVRNDIKLFDTHLEAGATLELPIYRDWDAYFYVFSGEVSVQGQIFAEGE